MWTEKLKIGSQVWIQDTWGSKPPVRVSVVRIWKGPTARHRHFHIEPQAFGQPYFNWNGTCQSNYHHAVLTWEDAA